MRRFLLLVAVGTAMVGAAAVVAADSASPALAAIECASDPQGDAAALNDEPETARVARADIIQVCLDYTASALAFSLAVAEPVDPGTDASWTAERNPAEIHFQVDLNGDRDYDETFFYRAPDGQIVVEQAREGGCTGTGAYQEQQYIAVVHPSCLDDPARVRVAAYMTYPDDPSRTDSPTWYDFTELSHPVSPPVPGRATSRLAGPTRIETAIAISRHQFPDSAPVVYLANATRTVDAVAGGSLTDGPILLVPSCGPVPSAVAAEIRRLNPTTVTALGGPRAVCEETLAAAARS